MKQTTETELKEKLARFAGLELICSREDDEWHRGIWKTKEGIQISTPDFIHDIAACIEYLGPKLHYWEISTSFKGYMAVIGVTVGHFPNIEDTPALAFSRAVEQAIDKGAK